MLRNYFKIAWRSFLKDRQFTLLNLLGLVTGLSTALLIFLWMNDEWKVDKFHEADNQLYQVMQIYPIPDGIKVVDWTQALLAETLKEELSEVELATSMKPGRFDNGIVTYNDENYRANGNLVSPAYDFQFSFLDADYQALYEAETRTSILSKYFTGLAIIIACLGLFGLATFTAEQKSKEISIRKVLGASIPNVIMLLSKDFLKLVLIALIIGVPVAWYLMQKWLQRFAYHIELTWWMFLLAGIAIILITLITISFQSIRAALINPVESLYRE